MANADRLDGLLDALRTRGVRVTAARRAVLAELVAAGHDHLTADDLAARIAIHQPTTHLSTIYRTLDSLTESGVLTQARFSDKSVTYHLAGDVHHHAVCDHCGRSIQVPIEVFDPVRDRLLTDHGFAATPRHLTITGICAACRS